MSICIYERYLHDARMLMSHVVIQEHCSKIELSLHCSSVCRQTGRDLLMGRCLFSKYEIEHAFVYACLVKTEWSVKDVGL